MDFSIFTEFYNHHHKLILEYFCSLRKKLYPLEVNSHPSLLPVPGNHLYAFFLSEFAGSGHYKKRNHTVCDSMILL